MNNLLMLPHFAGIACEVTEGILDLIPLTVQFLCSSDVSCKFSPSAKELLIQPIFCLNLEHHTSTSSIKFCTPSLLFYCLRMD